MIMIASDPKGMTVNERLFTLGLIEQFEAAVSKRDLEESVSVLIKAGLTTGQASETVLMIFENPEIYGF